MIKEYLEPQVRLYLLSSSLMDEEQTSASVYDDPQDPGGALGNSTDMWEEDNVNMVVSNPNVWDNE